MQQSGVSILHIDDDEALSRLVARALERRGFRVSGATDAQSGLERLAAGKFDAVVLDHYLASGTGMVVLNELRQRPDSPPVIYVTGSMDAALAVEALKAGADDYVLKSVGDDFITLLASAVEQAIKANKLRLAKEQAEREVHIARDRAELLLAEVNHRVANSLALVSALVRMQSAAISDEAAKSALAETQGRINAIANLHRSLYTSDDVRNISLSEYLKTLIEELDTSMASSGVNPQVRLELDCFSLPPDRAVSVGMIVTELLTNAYKYAYPAGSEGEVRVFAIRDSQDRLVLTVEDDGIGWSGEGVPQGTGLGTRIVKAMAATLGTTLTYGDGIGGTRTTLVLER